MIDQKIRISKVDADFLSVIFVGLLVSFVWMMPPFIDTDMGEKIVRLAIEFLVLIGASLYLFVKKSYQPFIFLIIVFVLYMMNWIVSAENIRHVLSHFCQITLLFLLSEVLVLNYGLASFLKNVWIITWTYFSFLAILTFLGKVSGLLVFNYVGDSHTHHYYQHLFLGYFLMKEFSIGLTLPRYVGFLNEPIIYAFFAGFNMVAAKRLFLVRKNSRRFFVLNMIAGMLTFSYSFYLFLGVFFLFWGYLKRVPSKYIFMGGMLVIVIFAYMGKYLYMSDSSLSVRVGRYYHFVEYIKNFGIENVLFGVGMQRFVLDTNGAGTSALINTLVGKGIFLFLVWAYLLHARSKYIPGLLAFIVYYSLVLDFYVYPLFVVGVAIVTSYSQIKPSDP